MQCPYFEQCGGCYYSVPYERQLKEKKKQLKETLNRDIDITPSPVTEGYRQRMDYVYAFKKLGLRKRSNFREVVDIKHCQLISERMNNMLKKVRNLLKTHDIKSYDYLNHEGYLRYVTMREAKFTGQLMLGFVTADKREDIMPVIEELKDDCDSVVWLVNETKTDTSYGQVYKSYNNNIQENFDGVKLNISPNVFFQPNPYVAKDMAKKIRENVKGRTLELYCGIGTLGLYCADRTKTLTGVESVCQAIELAKENATENNINAEFICHDSEKHLNNKLVADTIIADPPRAGMGRKTCRKILWKKPKRVIIMSCNPKTLSYDLKFFEKKYNIRYLQGFDMFPHTKHVEGLCVLDRKPE